MRKEARRKRIRSCDDKIGINSYRHAPCYTTRLFVVMYYETSIKLFFIYTIRSGIQPHPKVSANPCTISQDLSPDHILRCTPVTFFRFTFAYRKVLSPWGVSCDSSSAESSSNA